MRFNWVALVALALGGLVLYMAARGTYRNFFVEAGNAFAGARAKDAPIPKRKGENG